MNRKSMEYQHKNDFLGNIATSLDEIVDRLNARLTQGMENPNAKDGVDTATGGDKKDYKMPIVRR